MKRVISPDAEFTNRIKKEILNGSNETREAWQSNIVEHKKNGTEFLYFCISILMTIGNRSLRKKSLTH